MYNDYFHQFDFNLLNSTPWTIENLGWFLYSALVEALFVRYYVMDFMYYRNNQKAIDRYNRTTPGPSYTEGHYFSKIILFIFWSLIAAMPGLAYIQIDFPHWTYNTNPYYYKPFWVSIAGLITGGAIGIILAIYNIKLEKLKDKDH